MKPLAKIALEEEARKKNRQRQRQFLLARLAAGVQPIVSGPPVIFTPQSISGNEIWLRSDLGVTTVDDAGTDRVSSWTCQSSARDFAQSIGAKRPEYVSGAINHLNFDNSNDNLIADNDTGLTYSNGTIFAIFDPEGVSSSKGIFTVYDSGSFNFPVILQLLPDNQPTFSINNESENVSVTVDDDTIQSAIAHWEGGDSAQLVTDSNGSADDDSFGTPSGIYDRIVIGEIVPEFNSVPFNGKIYEICYWPRRLNSSERAQLFEYASSRYGTSVPAPIGDFANNGDWNASDWSIS